MKNSPSPIRSSDFSTPTKIARSRPAKSSQIGVDEGAVSTALSRLKDHGIVEHKATYWAITDDTERLNGYSGYERATALFNQQLGTEDKGPWREHALECRGRTVTDEETPTFERGDVIRVEASSTSDISYTICHRG